MDSGGAKAPIQLLGKAKSCLEQLLHLQFWVKHGAKGEFSRLFNPVYLFDNKSCTWQHDHGRYWYLQKEHHHEGVDIWNYVKTCITFHGFCYFFYLLVCLIIFTHFYICIVWFVLANKRIWKCIFFVLKFITIFIPVNILLHTFR